MLSELALVAPVMCFVTEHRSRIQTPFPVKFGPLFFFFKGGPMGVPWRPWLLSGEVLDCPDMWTPAMARRTLLWVSCACLLTVSSCIHIMMSIASATPAMKRKLLARQLMWLAAADIVVACCSMYWVLSSGRVHPVRKRDWADHHQDHASDLGFQRIQLHPDGTASCTGCGIQLATVLVVATGS